MDGKVTISLLQQMKREGKKSIGLVAWDYQMARIADRAGFDFISVGDSSASIYGAAPTFSTSRWTRC
jgi:3-methyl-2-oxobutanoate hydroxymethyltransferase